MTSLVTSPWHPVTTPVAACHRAACVAATLMRPARTPRVREPLALAPSLWFKTLREWSLGISGWWYTYPSEKYESQLGLSSPRKWWFYAIWWDISSGVIKHGVLENWPFIGDFPTETSMNMGFSIAMFDYQRVLYFQVSGDYRIPNKSLTRFGIAIIHGCFTWCANTDICFFFHSGYHILMYPIMYKIVEIYTPWYPIISHYNGISINGDTPIQGQRNYQKQCWVQGFCYFWFVHLFCLEFRTCLYMEQAQRECRDRCQVECQNRQSHRMPEKMPDKMPE